MEKKTNIPVVITEDHHEVLPHIYRRIGSKLLPFSHLTLVHFDSHPDLLIPIDMPADDVFNTEVLYQTMSIENWIMPAVYAGHVDHVIWLKPPWCDQISDKQICFFVGKCSDTGRIRLSSTENYFLSEALFVPEEKLLNKKSFCLTVLTLKPDNWHELPVKEKSVSPVKGNQQIESEETLKVIDNNVRSLAKGDNSVVTNPEIIQSECIKTHDQGKIKDICSKGSDANNYPGKRTCEMASDQGHQKHTEGVKSADNLQTNCSKDFNVPKKKTRIDIHEDSTYIFDLTRKRDGVQQILKKLKTELDSKPFILDIDLDFFSTMNPFRCMLTEYQYNSLRRLYRFTPPVSAEPQFALECLKKREQQLAELKSAMLSEENNLIGEDRELLTLLLKDIEKTGEVTGNVIERGLLHEAGCTCDDTELPHHVSTEEQVQELTVCMDQLLSELPQPEMITIARSSLDDYCPPDQVDFIQELVMENLNHVYDQLNVQKDYNVHQDST